MVERLLDGTAATEQAESAIHAAVGRIGSAALQTVMQAWVDRADAQRPTSPGMSRQGRRPIWVRSLWGEFQILRAYYTRTDGGPGTAPADRLLGLWSSYTPGLARTLCRLSAQIAFAPAAELLRDMTHASVNARQFHRFTAQAAVAARAWVRALKPPDKPPETLYVSFDGTGVPMRREHLQGRKGRNGNGRAKTREMRLGCVFTQTTADPKGNAVRDPGSTTYLAALLSSRPFGRMIRAEAVRRGLRRAKRVVVITDGAGWCGTAAAMNFPGHLHILDFYHAAEHLGGLAQAVFGEGRQANVHFRLWRRRLLRGKAAAVIEQARGMLAQAQDPVAVQHETAYLERNLKRMQYDQYRQQGLFIGSGVVEAGCKTVVGQRAKQSGMFWGVTGVQDVLQLRCLLLSRRMDTFFRDTCQARRTA